MDIKQQITDAVNKITKDDKMKAEFTKNPVQAVEKVLGVDLPDDVISKVVDGVKAKLAGDKIGGAIDSIKKMF